MQRPMHRALPIFSGMRREGHCPPYPSGPVPHPHQPETGANRLFQFPCFATREVTGIRATCGTNLGPRKDEFAPPLRARWIPVCWYGLPGDGAARYGEGPSSFAQSKPPWIFDFWRSYLTQCIYSLVLEKQLPHQIVDLMLWKVKVSKKLTIFGGG